MSVKQIPFDMSDKFAEPVSLTVPVMPTFVFGAMLAEYIIYIKRQLILSLQLISFCKQDNGHAADAQLHHMIQPTEKKNRDEGSHYVLIRRNQ